MVVADGSELKRMRLDGQAHASQHGFQASLDRLRKRELVSQAIPEPDDASPGLYSGKGQASAGFYAGIKSLSC